MSDHIERACTRCGSLLHHADAGSCDRRFYVSELGMVRDDLAAEKREHAKTRGAHDAADTANGRLQMDLIAVRDDLRDARTDRAASCRESAALGAMVARLRGALERIISTDTHGKNVPDELGAMRPTGTDFCGRCNRNSFHPHADDCPIARIDAALALTPATAGAEYQALVEVAKAAEDLIDAGNRQRDNFDRQSAYTRERNLCDAIDSLNAARALLSDRAPGKDESK